jgi:hypothetical protein
LFNKAAIFFEGKIEPAISTAIAELVRVWLEKCGWRGKADFGDNSFWVCPTKWKEESLEPFAKFAFTNRPNVETLSYHLADMCGIGQSEWGFQFLISWSWPGGIAGRAAFAKGMGELADEVVKMGWTNLGKGMFFRPVKLPADLLDEAWTSEDWTVFLTPLEQALNALAADLVVFDKIIENAKPNTKQAAP